MHKFAAIGILSVFMIGCDNQPAEALPEKLEAAFQEALPLCERMFLPNAQAREFGDLEEELSETDAKIANLSKIFQSKDGEQFLQAKIRDEKDDIAKGCAEKLLGVSPE
ncbi:hypothetical protein [Phyllobacterium phragmitis]|uniref:Lipoprotein n=1 Tax=Phyllobacterium phragmitis TaxID=2670329 RepID=A0ABQ0GYS6_9HYPH